MGCCRPVTHVLAELIDGEFDCHEIARRDHIDDDLLRHLCHAALLKRSLPLDCGTLLLEHLHQHGGKGRVAAVSDSSGWVRHDQHANGCGPAVFVTAKRLNSGTGLGHAQLPRVPVGRSAIGTPSMVVWQPASARRTGHDFYCLFGDVAPLGSDRS
jgi:hypothetical protein